MKRADAILEALSHPVLVLDASLVAVLANTAFCDTLAVAPDRWKGKSLHELFAGERGEQQVTELVAAVLAPGGEVSESEIVCVIPPDTRKILFVTVRRVTLEEKPEGLVLVELREITREKEIDGLIQELNDALLRHAIDLEAINQELESFTHSVSHDLRTPLRLMSKITHLLLHDGKAPLHEEARGQIELILDTTVEMGVLVESLLALSQVSLVPMKTRRVDMKRLAREALGELKDQQAERNVKVQIGPLPPCTGNRALLKQVYMNLLENSLKFTRTRSEAEIEVGFLDRNGAIIYFVRDNGVGFPIAQADSIFLVFNRLHKDLGFGGTGIGLSLTKRIIARHGGRTWAEGVPDGGATIYFTLAAATPNQSRGDQ